MPFLPGDRVHIATIGTGVVREVRNARRYVVEVKGRSMIVSAAQLARAEDRRAPRQGDIVPPSAGPEDAPAAGAIPTLDLHGKTVAEATAILDEFLNDAMLGGQAVVHVIHGRSGGRVRAAVHARLARVPSVRRFRLDPRNPGVTIVAL